MALLRLQHLHRSQQIGDMNLIDCYHHFLEEPNPLIATYLKQAGFSIAAKLGSVKIDKALVTAVVERWRPETHTFHLPVGECTITLEDVSLQLGLRVDGIPVFGPSMLDWKFECERLLGEAPPQEQMKGQAIKLKWLQQNFATLPQEATEEQIKAHCRAYILRLIEGVLISDKSCTRVHLMYLPLLEDFQHAGRYSWGSACLENLYREMCRGSAITTSCMGGCTLLLQSWVWYRMPFLAPQCNRGPSFPLAERWSGRGLKFVGTPRGDITGYRCRLDHMHIHQFIWVPYREILDSLPEEAFQDSAMWTANTALICFQIVEWHQTDRVKLQFGLRQEIPDAPQNMDKLHAMDMRGNHSENWKDVHAYWIQLWRKRRRHVIEGQPIQGYVMHSEEYIVWFRSNSKLYLSSPPQLQDPRGYVQDPLDVGPSMPTQQRPCRAARRQLSSPIAFTPSQQHFDPPRYSFAFSPTQQEAPENFDARRHSFTSSDNDFMSNLFGVDVGTPQSAATYMQNMYTFGTPSLPNYAAGSSSTSYIGELREDSSHPTANPDVNDNEPQQEQFATAVGEDQTTRHRSRRIQPPRNRKPPRCGTGHHLGY